jgi:hypothetical protein
LLGFLLSSRPESGLEDEVEDEVTVHLHTGTEVLDPESSTAQSVDWTGMENPTCFGQEPFPPIWYALSSVI